MWTCEKCKAKFTSRAYGVSKPQTVKSIE
ncbi:MAG: hypothetical protein ACP5NW_02760 [Candidatus Woesearchaeota archaeon]